jgi:hypothetical protein
VRHSIDSLLTRACIINGASVQPGSSMIIPVPTAAQTQISISLWTTSLLQFLQNHNLQLAKGANSTPTGPDEPLTEFLLRHGYSSSHLLATLSLHNIYTVSDDHNRHTSRWAPALKHLLQTVSPMAPLPDLSEALPPTGVRIGQLWHTHAPSLNEAAITAPLPHGRGAVISIPPPW